jgi:hypothetical protein
MSTTLFGFNMCMALTTVVSFLRPVSGSADLGSAGPPQPAWLGTVFYVALWFIWIEVYRYLSDNLGRLTYFNTLNSFFLETWLSFGELEYFGQIQRSFYSQRLV